MREKKILTTNVFLQNLLFFRNNRIKYEGWGGGGESIITELIPCAIKINTI